MLAKIFMILSASFLLSVIVGLIAGRAISVLGEAHAPGFVQPLETDCTGSALNEIEEEILVLAHAQM